MTFPIDFVRSQFPGLNNDMILMDNAGGSQTLQTVVDRIGHYLIHHDVQLGASYGTSAEAGLVLDDAVAAVQLWINAQAKEEVIIGPSTTALLRMLSLCLAQQWQAGDEIIISDVDHEANRACWKSLEKQGFLIKTWCINTETMQLETDDLLALMTDKTRMVCVTHVSNVLGNINPIKDWAKLVHDQGAQICVDGVAYAPHRSIDVQDWDVDYYVFSTYKTFGPHQAVMYGKQALLEAMPGLNHEFITTSPYKFQPGNLNYELSYSLKGVVEYLCELGSDSDTIELNRDNLDKAFDQIANHEARLVQKLIDFIASKPQLRVIGANTADPAQRVATLSFAHESMDSKDIVEAVDPHKIGIRFGDFYAVELVKTLGLADQNGVVRVSLAHYNTKAEVEKLIDVLDDILNS